MKHFFRNLSILAAVAVVVLLGTSPAAANAAAAAPAPAPTGGGGTDIVNESTIVDGGRSIICLFETRGDWVHVTAGEASGHGWWVNRSCKATRAVVTIQLQEFYSDGKWRNVGGPVSATLASGTYRRANKRAGCITTGLTGWRSIVEVDVIGVADDARKLTTTAVNINCRR
ncbi:hypothetical protein [Parafrankia sp. EUN1f]|uniref:hypothetical protein n=1 Tax=Parafrankia sp. EUN1f TaxID=102897 RepID=UPI0001C43A5B|nr:hypothetical protein [Parafrankia sp. EUN1f]EFC84203.1 hypothetical protein FrEUN1fDRAFT_2620 [Parafrankia sp. EUN1f]